jgi:hypothetical protein
MQGWLPLNEYSIRYRISLSTLRRRIRNNEIKFRFDDGKYWLLDAPTSKHMKVQFKNTSTISPASDEPAAPFVLSEKTPLPKEIPNTESPLLVESHDMLKEIKDAFIKVLQEKEEQILNLNEEIADLKTLVRMLEVENERLKTNLQESAPIDKWLNQNIDFKI